ncbi:hypothetical protein HMPREF9089_01016 [Eubacterium brachy ATCC 33089]|nr:hypothetical protein HMPREF9089_01016 [Eubacterium brachy ATCC 33089]
MRKIYFRVQQDGKIYAVSENGLFRRRLKFHEINRERLNYQHF